MGNEKIIMSDNITLQGEVDLYVMATKLKLENYVVVACGEIKFSA